MSTDIASALLAELERFARPLAVVAHSHDPLGKLRQLLRGAGWYVTVDVDPAAITSALDSLILTVETLAADPVPDGLGEVIDRIEMVSGLVGSIRSIGDDLASLGDGAPPTPEASAALAEDLAHHLTIKWIRSKGELLGVAEMADLIRWVDVEAMELAWLARPAGPQRRVSLDAVTDLIADPSGFLTSRVAPMGWPTEDHAASTILMLQRAFGPLVGGRGPQFDPRRRALGADPARRPLTSTVVLPLPTARRGVTSPFGLEVEARAANQTLPSGASGPGVALVPYGSAAVDTSFGAWDLSISAQVDLRGQPFEITPSGTTGAPGATAAIDMMLSREVGLVVGLGRTGFTLGRLELASGVGVGTGTATELQLSVVARDSSIGFSTADFGSAIAKVLPLDVQVPFDLGLEWSSLTGISLAGSAALALSFGDIEIPGGVFALRNLVLGLDLGEQIAIGVVGDVHFDLNVLQAVVEGIGIETVISFPPGGGNLGQAHLAFGIVLPDAVGFTIDLESVKGGGFVSIDHEIGRYAGALSLEIVSVGITAVAVIDTQLPGGDDGYAVFASLTATFPGIQLGFGFVLTGVGGIVAINRTVDAEALASGLRTGVIDALLFPDDPVGDSAQLIAQIDDYFPIMEGNAVFGPVIELGWGTPTLITAQLGVIISIPDGVIAVMGSVSALLPVPDAPLLTLHMDCLGVVDVAAGTFSLSASLYDSRLLATIDLGGDMAMYLRATDQPYFLMSVGGYHPTFRPPSTVPASMHDLRRMSASIDIADVVTVTIQAYFAVTSNSVQFGASVNLEASVEIWPTTYTARGWFEFDVLLIFSPFKIVAGMSAGVGIYAGNKELMGVDLAAHLEGPEPWFASGRASFKFFGLKVEFEIEVGGKAVGEPKPIVHPRADVLAALALPSSWQEAGPIDGLGAGITYLTPAGESSDTTWVRPDHQLTVRQSIAPLDRTLDIIGQAVPAVGEELLHIDSVRIGSQLVETTPALDWFAPAQFEELTQADKLTRASFEEMNAGVTFGHPEAAITVRPDLTTSVDTAYVEGEWTEEDGSLLDSVHSGAAGMALAKSAATTEAAFVIASTEYALVNAVDGTPLTIQGQGILIGGSTMSQYEARRARASRIAADPRARAQLVVVPASAAVVTIVPPDIDPVPWPLIPPRRAAWPPPVPVAVP